MKDVWVVDGLTKKIELDALVEKVSKMIKKLLVTGVKESRTDSA